MSIEEIEGQTEEGDFLVPLSQSEIQMDMQEVRAINIQIESLNLKASILIKEVTSGRGIRRAIAFRIPNYDTGNYEYHCRGIMVKESKMEEAHQPQPEPQPALASPQEEEEPLPF